MLNDIHDSFSTGTFYPTNDQLPPSEAPYRSIGLSVAGANVVSRSLYATEFAKIARIIASPYFNISLVTKNLQSFSCLMFRDSRFFFFHLSAKVASLISLNCYSICLLEHFPAQKLHVSSSR